METKKIKKITSKEGVGYILDRVPATSTNYKLLILMHWSLFDNIDIPPEVIKSILDSGTNPETISRSKRNIRSVQKNASRIITGSIQGSSK